MKTAAGKFETHYIDRKTGVAHKVMCGKCSGKNRAGMMNSKFAASYVSLKLQWKILYVPWLQIDTIEKIRLICGLIYCRSPKF